MRLLFVCLLTWLTTVPLHAQDLSEYVVYYQASTNGIGGEGERRLEQQADGSYLLSNHLTAEVLGQSIANLQQSVAFDFNDKEIVPQHYRYELRGLGAELQTVDYDWAAGLANSREDDQQWQLQLAPQTFDLLSHQLAMRLQLGTNKDLQEEYAFTLIDGGELEEHRYRMLGEEVLDTAMGKLNTVKLQRIRENTDRVTTVWLATDWEYLLARIEQQNGRMRIELNIRAAEMNGQPINPLP
ncbi:MAG: DUF3108 domain-containing protein [Gammaproteobacteria bacterium]